MFFIISRFHVQFIHSILVACKNTYEKLYYPILLFHIYTRLYDDNLSQIIDNSMKDILFVLHLLFILFVLFFSCSVIFNVRLFDQQISLLRVILSCDFSFENCFFYTFNPISLYRVLHVVFYLTLMAARKRWRFHFHRNSTEKNKWCDAKSLNYCWKSGSLI